LKALIYIILLLISAPLYAAPFYTYVDSFCGTSPRVNFNDGSLPAECIRNGVIWDVTTAIYWHRAQGQAIHYAHKSGLKPGIAIVIETLTECKDYLRLVDDIEYSRVILNRTKYGLIGDMVQIDSVQWGIVMCTTTIAGGVKHGL